MKKMLKPQPPQKPSKTVFIQSRTKNFNSFGLCNSIDFIENTLQQIKSLKKSNECHIDIEFVPNIEYTDYYSSDAEVSEFAIVAHFYKNAENPNYLEELQNYKLKYKNYKDKLEKYNKWSLK